jgi:hypothetical protein
MVCPCNGISVSTTIKEQAQMKKIVFTSALIVLVAAAANAQTGNGAPSGPHYNLNIIGVDKAKTATLTGSDRHTIFVELGAAGAVDPKRSYIYLMPAAEFRVCDGNAFDAAYDCSGAKIKPLGAVFSLPCNLNISAPTTGDVNLLQPCDPNDTIPDASYAVFARGLGKPGKNGTDPYAVMTTCATDVVTLEVVCSTENTLDVGALVRKTGKMVFKDVTNELTSLQVCVVDPITLVETCTRYALFDDNFIDFFWQYDNFGLKLAQLRFYPVTQ